MRTMLLAALALSSTVNSSIADACGGWPARVPAMFLVTAHFGRTFVQLGGPVANADQQAWWEEQMTYDHTKVAPAPALAAERTFTLVGDHARVASTGKQVFLDPAWDGKGPMTALEVAQPEREITPRFAIEGVHDAVWAEMRDIEVTAEDRAWAASAPFTPAIDPRLLSAARVDADLVLITAYATGHATTYVKWGNAAPTGGYEGTPRGVVTVDGLRYVVFVDGNTVRPVRI